MTITIVGAGMAGLLAANMLRSRHERLTIVERQPTLPNNHSAVLRFRSSVVGDVLGVPFRRVTMIKDTVPWRNPIADALAYSCKNTGHYRSDRSVTRGMVKEERFIAPGDFIQQMAARLLRPSSSFKFDAAEDFSGPGPFISTIPMPALMDALSYPGERPTFHHRQGVNLHARVKNCDAYATLSIPDPDEPFSRVTLTGDQLIVEFPQTANVPEAVIARAASCLGLRPGDLFDISMHEQHYAKILPVDDELRKTFMHHATVHHNVYSLGRYACWRPGLLLDDVVQDVRKIEGWIGANNKYDLVRDRRSA